MQMANAKSVIRGQFTVPLDTGNKYTLQIGKTLSQYMFFVEATDESKQQLMELTINNAKMIGAMGCYPARAVNNVSLSPNYSMFFRVNPTTGVLDATNNQTISYYDSYIEIYARSIDSGAVQVYKGLTYNYVICEL